MAIQRIESVTYGVDDVAESVRFFTDFGLELVEDTRAGARLTTLSGAAIVLRPIDDPALPTAVAPGNGIREVVWGVDTAEALAVLVAGLRTDREVVEGADGVFHTYDETGYGVGFTVAAPVEITHPVRRYNRTGRVERLNEMHGEIQQVTPFRICHVALNIPKEGKEKANGFYLDRLGFRATDIVEKMGIFLQAEGDHDQHTLLLCHRPDRAGTNHTSYEVAGFDDVIEGANHMIEKGWRESRRLGRHTIGSNVFRFIQSPAGGRVEYAADMDRVDESYETRVHVETPPHHIWTLRTNNDDDTHEEER
jgi:catechol 2,3-dioxygenase-like lactoylglutathione lyase family enzyme